MSDPNYLVITPVRDEAAHLSRTISSMAEQTIRPSQWIIVDDGSTDGTREIIDQAVRKHSWITGLHRQNRGYRKSGGGVVEAFSDGYVQIKDQSWHFLVKFDGDLAFDHNYFRLCLERFVQDPQLGVGGGTICRSDNGKLVEEWTSDPPFHVRGATKIYRRACWDQIAPLVPSPGWDTIDELRAKIHGWNTYTFHDIQIHQLKPTGSADGGWKNWVKNGLANYVTHYHPLFMLTKCGARACHKPYVLEGLGLFCGYMKGYLQKFPRPDDPQLRQYVRQQQINRLLGRPNIWDVNHTPK